MGYDQKYIEDKYSDKSYVSFIGLLNFYLFEYIINDHLGDLRDFELLKRTFLLYEITPSIKAKYLCQYWQLSEESVINGKTIKNIYSEMLNWKKENREVMRILSQVYRKNRFEVGFPKNDFENLISVKECTYCHIDRSMVEKLISSEKLFKKHITRGWEFEIDRRDPNGEYTKDNCVLCCYWCNNAKTDEFTYEEFKLIGPVIRKVWEQRLN